MVPLEQESSIEVLRAYSILATREVERLTRELADARKQNTEQGYLSDALKDQLVKLQQKFFGFGRETLPNRPATNRQSQLLLVHSERMSPIREEQGDQSHRKQGPGDLPKTTFYEQAIEELEKEALSRGYEMNKARDWEEIKGLTQDSTEVTVVEHVYQKVIHKQKKYRFLPSVGTDKELIVTAPGPVKLKSGCKYSVDFALAVVSDKYEYHCPLERQRRKMEASGLEVSVKTLYSLAASVAEHANTVLPQIREDIFNDRKVAVHLDETPWLILCSESQSYMWVMSNRSATYFQFEPTRSGKVAEELLKGYEGCILSDGFSGYDRFKKDPGFIVGNCWAHARREFYDLYDSYPFEVVEIIDLMDKVFDLEYEGKNWELLKDARETKSTPAVKLIYEKLLETRQKHLPGSGLVKAIDYCLGRWKELTAFLIHLPLPMTNNDPERALGHVVMGRKNFAGSKTIDGADVAATLYTIIESCKKAELQPKVYLKYLITERWHKRQPLSPLRYAWSIRGKPKHAL